MLEHHFRKTYDQLLIKPLITRKWMRSIHPQMITLAGGMIGLLTLPFLSFDMPAGALICLGFSGFLDTLDGALARLKGFSSNMGAVTDILSDRAVEFAVILGLYLQEPQTRGFLCLLMLGSILLCVTSFLVVGIFIPNEEEKSFHYSPGLIERAEAFIFFALMILFPHRFGIISALFCALVLITTAIRVIQFKLYARSS